MKQKAKDDVAKAIESKDGEQEAQQARAELLESKEMLSKSKSWNLVHCLKLYIEIYLSWFKVQTFRTTRISFFMWPC